MRKSFICALIIYSCLTGFAQQDASVTEYLKSFPTYPFSDPDPIPRIGRLYPYFRFDGFTTKPVDKEWKVVELENDFIRIMILPQIGGKIWAAIEKSSNRSFIYYNHTVKFRDVAMRGPWTSGGIEANYGIIGHTPNCATPVDYTTIKRPDGSVSCIIGVLDLLTRTRWSVDINLEKDKAYFTTSAFWYNASPLEQPYYSWMNTGIKTSQDLQFIYPGNKYLGHEGEYSSWPINHENGKDISWYRNNDFGGYKSYHVFGEYSDFFGAYWHDEDFGMGRYSTHADKPGKKLWIWGLSGQGMIWEKLLTDHDGQYAEVQSGRLFNQSSDGSTLTPFKHLGFMPHTSDLWTEYWFPVVKTEGFVLANNYGALNAVIKNGVLHIHLSPLQPLHEKLVVLNGSKEIYAKDLSLGTLQLFNDSLSLNGLHPDSVTVRLGASFLKYSFAKNKKVLNRPVDAPTNFDWNTAYGLFLLGKENLKEREYQKASLNLESSISKDSNFMPALVNYGMLLYRNRDAQTALKYLRRALSVDTYDPAANFYYGLVNMKLGNISDAKDGFDIASLNMSYRSAAYTELSKIYFKEENYKQCILYAQKSIDFNRYAIGAWELFAIASRKMHERERALGIIDTILKVDPLNHFAAFEKYQNTPTDESRKLFSESITSEMPVETYLELAITYSSLGLTEEAKALLNLSPLNAEVKYWLAYLNHSSLSLSDSDAVMVFPFRNETADILEDLISENDHWLLKYHLALIEWNNNDTERAKTLLQAVGNSPGYAPFYAARAELTIAVDGPKEKYLADVERSAALDSNEWRYGKMLTEYYLAKEDFPSAITIARKYWTANKNNYLMEALLIKSLSAGGEYAKAARLLEQINILPNEGATDGREIYREVQLMLAIENLANKKFKQAQEYVEVAKEWPERLGVGKPYEEDIDLRLENWITYRIFLGAGKKKLAFRYLEKILATPYSLQSPFSPLTLVDAWAIADKAGERAATNYLAKTAKENPDNVWIAWAKASLTEDEDSLPAGLTNNTNYRLVKKLTEIAEEKSN